MRHNSHYSYTNNRGTVWITLITSDHMDHWWRVFWLWISPMIKTCPNRYHSRRCRYSVRLTDPSRIQCWVKAPIQRVQWFTSALYPRWCVPPTCKQDTFCEVVFHRFSFFWEYSQDLRSEYSKIFFYFSLEYFMSSVLSCRYYVTSIPLLEGFWKITNLK